jgi:hypothetical protein
MEVHAAAEHARIEGVEPISTWPPEDVKAHIEFQVRRRTTPWAGWSTSHRGG